MLVRRFHLVALLAFSISLDQRATAWAGEPITSNRPPVKPLKVFILAGQSNMQGHARISTFESLADDPKTAPLLKEMLGANGKPAGL